MDIQTGEEANCQTRLLGEHSISNLLLCCTAARALGMTLPEIALGVSHCQPVEHRLELLDGGAGVSIIDDAFNANPVGAQCALRVIKAFPGRRIIITPGMVELGGKEDDLTAHSVSRWPTAWISPFWSAESIRSPLSKG